MCAVGMNSILEIEETENLSELLKDEEWDELKILFLLDWGGVEEVSSYSEYFILASRGEA